MTMTMRNGMRRGLGVLTLGCVLLLTGCFGRIPVALNDAILNQNDPETVSAGVPAYLILLDTLIADDPADADLLRAGAKLYALYGASLVDDTQRAARLTERARHYGEAAWCAARRNDCDLTARPYEEFNQLLAGLDNDELPELYALAVSWLAWMQAHNDDWSALADLPKIESLLTRIVILDNRYENGNPHLYLGILKSLRPAALGGQPEEGRIHFEQALDLSGSKALNFKVAYARYYARTVFDRELHDRLLTEVLDADPEQPGLTLLNVLAQREARQLLLSAEEYF